jgi:Family of unknown function (DUF6527)
MATGAHMQWCSPIDWFAEIKDQITMQLPARKIRFRGIVENRHEADGLLEQPGDSVTVIRGWPRSFVMACPDGCGSVLTVNLDPRAGKAWRFYGQDRRSLSPSVWRDSGCGAHFVLWKDKILWCDANGESELPAYEPIHEETVLAILSDTPKSVHDLADELDEIPWEVDRTLRQLVRAGQAEAIGKDPARFRRVENVEIPLSPKRKKRSWWQRLWHLN